MGLLCLAPQRDGRRTEDRWITEGNRFLRLRDRPAQSRSYDWVWGHSTSGDGVPRYQKLSHRCASLTVCFVPASCQGTATVHHSQSDNLDSDARPAQLGRAPVIFKKVPRSKLVERFAAEGSPDGNGHWIGQSREQILCKQDEMGKTVRLLRKRRLTEEVARPLQHDVVVVPVANPEDARGDAVARAGAREVLDGLCVLLGCTAGPIRVRSGTVNSPNSKLICRVRIPI